MSFAWLDSLSLWYVPIVIFSFIVVLGAVIGFINGPRVSLYFLLGNVIFFGIGLGLYSFIYDKIDFPQRLKNNLPNVDLKSFLGSLQGPLGYVYMSINLLVGSLILILIYPFVRKKLKSRGRNNELDYKKIRPISRYYGAGIGVLTSFLIAAPITSTAYVFTTKNDQNNGFLFKATSKSVEWISFGIYNDPKRIQTALNLSSLANSDVVKNIVDNINNFSKDPSALHDNIIKFLTKENIQKVQDTLNVQAMYDVLKYPLLDIITSSFDWKISRNDDSVVYFEEFKQKVEDATNNIGDGLLTIFKTSFEEGMQKHQPQNPKFVLSTYEFQDIINILLNEYVKFKNNDGSDLNEAQAIELKTLLTKSISFFATGF